MSETLNNTSPDFFKDRPKASTPHFNTIDADDPLIEPEVRMRYPNRVFLATNPNLTKSEIEIYALTQRQFEILEKWCSEPLSNKEMASNLVVSIHTLKRHFNAIFKTFSIQRSLHPGHPHIKGILASTLVSKGILEFHPSIPEEDFILKASQESPQQNHNQ
jgi:DNA-binding CsgD family transcriptional regulator